MQTQSGAAQIENIWKNFKVNKKMLLELYFTKTYAKQYANLHIQERLFKENNIFNTCQLNILHNIFLHRVKNGKMANVLLSKFLRPLHHYPINFSRNNYILPSFNLTKSKYRIAIRFPKLWNNILNKEEKLMEDPSIFHVFLHV